MIVDAHVHIDKYRDAELPAALAAIENRRIHTMAVSVDVESFAVSEDIAAGSDLVIAGFGVHPWEAPRYVDRLDQLDGLIERSPYLGEIGLDHRFVEDASLFPAQREVFEFFLHRAAAAGKLVNVHTVGAEADCATLLAAGGVERVIVHWYSGPLDQLARMIDAGICFTIGVEILRSDHIAAIARMVPAGQLLLETDNPGGQRWLTGQAGHPPLIEDVATELARVRATTPADIIELTNATMVRLAAGDPALEAWLA